jgi:hypothetical protein
VYISGTDAARGCLPKPSPLKEVRIFASAPLVTLFACASMAGSPRVVAVGDLHGDLTAALATLKMADVVDDSGHWSAGNATLVQTGDTTDRGPDSKGVMELIRRLQTEAKADGGRVIALLGNHEVMNLQGDWRYVSPGDLDGFGGKDKRTAAFAPDGDVGTWLRSLDVVAQVDHTVFCHGGVSPQYAGIGVAALNTAARASIDVEGGSEVLGAGGPLWYRDYVNEPEAVACPNLGKALAALGAKRMVVGHTTRRDGKIQVRCQGRLAVIDIGISDHYGAHHGALELTDQDAWAIYPTGRIDLADPP